MSFHEAQQYLNSFINFENHLNFAADAQFDLKRVIILLEALGSPQRELRVLHVAGTNGKGSVCAFAASMLQAAGYTVGLYTSPHLENFRERIQIFHPARGRQNKKISGRLISEKDFSQVLEEMKPQVERIRRRKALAPLTFFEVSTVLALYYFYQKKVDWVVLETGLGGRLDATNAVEALVCGITSVSLEHTRQLGDTLAKIAYEKAGIIKNKSQRVVLAPQPPQAMQVMENRCRQFAIQPAVIGRSVRYRILSQSLKELKFSVTTPQRKYLDLVSGLLGEHQAMNAALAIAMVESLQGQGLQISSAAVRQGVRCAVWPGRFEVVQKHPYIVLDGAHNPAAVHVLVKTVQNIFPRRKIILVLGLSRDKDQPAIAKILRSAAQEIILTKARHVRAAVLDEKEWARFFPVSNIRRAKSVKAALQQAKKIARKDEVILVTGSLFVVGEARAICTN